MTPTAHSESLPPGRGLGVTPSGQLLFRCGDGAMLLEPSDDNVRIHAQLEEELMASRQLETLPLSPPCFPGLELSDCCVDEAARLVLLRYEVPRQNRLRDLLALPTQLLEMVWRKGEQHTMMRIGPSRFDSELRLHRSEDPLLKRPQLDFSLQHDGLIGGSLLFSWDRQEMQVIQIAVSSVDVESPRISAAHVHIYPIQGPVLQDASQPWWGVPGRLALWNDLAQPSDYYVWDG